MKSQMPPSRPPFSILASQILMSVPLPLYRPVHAIHHSNRSAQIFMSAAVCAPFICIDKRGASCPPPFCTSRGGPGSLNVPAGGDNLTPTEFENIDMQNRTRGLAHPRAHRGTVASHKPPVERGTRTPPQLSKRQPCTVECKMPGLAHPRAHRGIAASHRPDMVKGMNRTLHQQSS